MLFVILKRISNHFLIHSLIFLSDNFLIKDDINGLNKNLFTLPLLVWDSVK